jgi:hypothetical protein
MREGIFDKEEVEQGAPALNLRSILAATLGNMLEFYDFITFSFFAILVDCAVEEFRELLGLPLLRESTEPLR